MLRLRCHFWNLGKVDKKANLHENKHTNSILEYLEYFCQMSSKLILIILSYTVSKLVHFLRHSVDIGMSFLAYDSECVKNKSVSLYLLRVKWCWFCVFTCRRWTHSSTRSTHFTLHRGSRSRSGWVWWLAARNAPSSVPSSLTISFRWRRNVIQRAPSCELTLSVTLFASHVIWPVKNAHENQINSAVYVCHRRNC